MKVPSRKSTVTLLQWVHFLQVGLGSDILCQLQAAPLEVAPLVEVPLVEAIMQLGINALDGRPTI